ncbi:venom carboxylesterase-6-like [Cloeon dipterum]|uniref:venom carboxylesterase-6-like n=1 Tax=Cloeon dipterum TaxID=197152 RepID=UPI0032209CD4
MLGPIKIIFIFSTFFISSGLAERPIVQTKQGVLEGVWQTSAKGAQYAAFMGIPFAQPPVGELRFEPPQDPEPWDGVWDAGDFGPSCIAFEHELEPGTDRQGFTVGQEDCLYLNVYTPRLPKEGEPSPKFDVILYIHGGAFMFGGGKYYGAKYIVDRNVIFVTINYRLGPMGFLSFEDEVVPGNNGLRDQVMAMKWVNRNIYKFGGNPDSVTLAGLSAGGASVHYHYLSMMPRGLHKNGISMSGTATCSWALVENAREKGMQFASSAGCDVEKDSEQILKCLKQRPAERLIKAVEQFFVWKYSPFTPFGPVVERKRSPNYDPFLVLPPEDIVLSGRMRRLPWMLGIVDAEGLYPVGTFINDEVELKKFDREFDELVPHLLHFQDSVEPADKRDVARKIRREYFGDREINKNVAKDIIKMASDRLFVYDSQWTAKFQSQFAPVFFYKVSRRPPFSLSNIMTGSNEDYGTSHVDDGTYFINMTFLSFEKSEEDEKFTEMMLDLWTTFAQDDLMMPMSEEMEWDWLEYDKDFNYVLLDKAPGRTEYDNDMGNAKFWSTLPLNEGLQKLHQKSKSGAKDEL